MKSCHKKSTARLFALAAASSLVVLTGIVAPTVSQTLPPDAFDYQGFFRPPPNAEGRTYQWAYAGLTVVPDCLGLKDPSPDDGYPGCMLSFQKQTEKRLVGLYDIVPPDGSKAQELRDPWPLFGQYPEEAHAEHFGRGLDRPYDLLYDRRPDGSCRIWWNFVFYYANGMKFGTPFLGVSSCDPDKPEPKGMWGFPNEKLGDNHPNRYSRSLGLIPQEIADRYFEGKNLLIGQGKGTGTRGSSGGPSFAVRPATIPDGPMNDFNALLWYRARGYPCWAEEQDFHMTVVSAGVEYEQDFTLCSQNIGGEVITDGQRSAVVTAMSLPLWDPEAYPYNRTDTIYHQGNPVFPDLRDPDVKLPVVYYGEETCESRQPPSFQEFPAGGNKGRCNHRERMPADCEIVGECHGGAGPHCNNIHSFLVLYDPAELAKIQKRKVDPWKVLPYANLDITHAMVDKCDWHWAGLAHDPERRILYLVSGGGDVRIHSWRIKRSSS